jgi:hypothetical protein
MAQQSRTVRPGTTVRVRSETLPSGRSSKLALAETCFELAGGDPLDALWFGIRATQLEAEYERERRRVLGPHPLADALRLLGEGLTPEEIHGHIDPLRVVPVRATDARRRSGQRFGQRFASDGR